MKDTSTIVTKGFAERFKSSIRFFASLFASREFAVLYCVVGTVAEIAHMYYLTYSISALSGWFKVAQAVMLSAFISSSLLYFVLISDDRDTTERGRKDSKRVNLAINIFTFINIAINFYYYCRHLIIDSTTWQLFDFIFAILVSCLLPVTIKLYANGIHVKDWVTSDIQNDEKSDTDNIDLHVIKDEIINDILPDIRQIITDDVVKAVNEIQLPNKEQIKIAFEEHSQLFLKQFENKLKILTDKKVKPITETINTQNEIIEEIKQPIVESDVIVDNNSSINIDTDNDSNSDTDIPLQETTESEKESSETDSSNDLKEEKIGVSFEEFLANQNM